MDYLKVFVVTDKKAFNKYLIENRNSDLSKIYDNYKNMEIHLVPVNVPNDLTIRYIGYTIQEYNVYIKLSEEWSRASFYKLHEGDIESLIDSKTIEDYEEYIQWKKINLFQVIDKEKFIDFIYDRLSDIEKIGIRNESKKAGEQLYYLFEVDDEFSDNYDYKLAVKFKHSPVAHIFPDVTLDENDISLLKENIIKSLDCKIHKKYNNISINNSKEYILLSGRLGYGFPKIWFNENGYVARTFVHNENGFNPHLIRAFGKTRDEALSNLRNKINDLKEKQLAEENKNLETSIEDDFSDY